MENNQEIIAILNSCIPKMVLATDEDRYVYCTIKKAILDLEKMNGGCNGCIYCNDTPIKHCDNPNLCKRQIRCGDDLYTTTKECE